MRSASGITSRRGFGYTTSALALSGALLVIAPLDVAHRNFETRAEPPCISFGTTIGDMLAADAAAYVEQRAGSVFPTIGDMLAADAAAYVEQKQTTELCSGSIGSGNEHDANR